MAQASPDAGKTLDVNQLWASVYDRAPEVVYAHFTGRPDPDALALIESQIRHAQAPAKQPITDEEAFLVLYYRGPEVLSELASIREHAQALWSRAQNGRTPQERVAARNRYQTLFSIPLGDLEDGRKRRRGQRRQDERLVANRYDDASARVRVLRGMRNPASVRSRLQEIFPKARAADLDTLVAWWRREPVDFRRAVCNALRQELMLEPASIPEFVARGRREIAEERRRAEQVAEWHRNAWRGYRRFIAWCDDKGIQPPFGAVPPTVPEP